MSVRKIRPVFSFLTFAVCQSLFSPSRAYDNISLASTAGLKKLVAKPSGLALGRGGRLFVADAAAGKVAVFSPEGKPEGAWGAKGKGPGQLGEPRGLAADGEGRLYVADAGNHRVQVFSADGKPLLSFGGKGEGPGQLSEPAGLAVSHDGVVYVADTGNKRVQAFSRDGIFLLGFGGAGEGPGQFKAPAHVAVSPAGRVYVTDASLKRIQVFTPEGKWLGLLEKPLPDGKKAKPAPWDPVGVAVDPYGYTYVADGEQKKVEEYDPEGIYAASFGAYGAGPGQFKSLAGLAVSPEGAVAAADDSLDRVQTFRLEDAQKVAPVVPGPTLRLMVKSLGSVPLAADDIAFLDDTLVGVNQKSNQVFLAAQRGKAPPKILGARGKGADQLNQPSGLFARDGRLYVADAGNQRVVVWDSSGKPVGPSAVGGAGKREGQFKDPRGVSVDAQGRLLVADPEVPRVQLFSRDGIFLSSLGAAGAGRGQYQKPVDVAALPKGAAVLDAGRKALLIFDEKGKPVGESVGDLVQPVALAADPAGKRGFAYVLDAGAGQVKIYDGAKPVAAFGSSSLLGVPKSLAVDDRGGLWISDGVSVKGFEARLVPLAPQKFAAAPGEAQIQLSWTKDPEGLGSSFALYRATAPAVFPKASYQVFAGAAASFTDREIVPGLTYYYALSAVSQDNEDQAPVEGARALSQAWTVRPANLPPLEIADIRLDPVFSAQYKYYLNNPVGQVTIKNNTEKTFQKIRVGFILQDFMDYATEKVVDRFEPGALESVELKAVLNNKILSVTEDTPIQAQLTITYYQDGEEKVFKRTEPFTLYSRNAMNWEDPRRLATFITAKDPPVLEFARSVVGAFQQEIESSPLNPAVAKAAAIFDALGAHGLTYLKDPNNPYEKAVQNTKTVDYVQYPRETLKRKNGDCDDLTNLYAAALESVSVPTVLLDVPGHVLLMFQTDESAPLALGLPADRLVDHEGSSWVPVEVTQVGKSFETAWVEGARAYRNAAGDDRVRVIGVHEAWEAYPPATLAEGETIPAPAKADVLAKFPDELSALADKRLSALAEQYGSRIKADPKDEDAHLQLGLAYAEHGKWAESAEWSDKLLALNPAHPGALNNRANVHWLKGEAVQARPLYEKAAAADPADGGVQLNLARAAWKLGDKSAAQKAYAKALELSPEFKKSFASLEEAVK